MQTILSSQVMNVQPSLPVISKREGFQKAEGMTQNSFCHQGSLWQGKTEVARQKRNQTFLYSLESGYIIFTYPAIHFTTCLSPNQTDYSFSCSIVKLISSTSNVDWTHGVNPLSFFLQILQRQNWCSILKLSLQHFINLMVGFTEHICKIIQLKCKWLIKCFRSL